MAFLGFGKKRKVLDLTENYKKQIERAEKERLAQKDSSAASGNGPFSFFDSSQLENTADESEMQEGTSLEKRKKLAKRILEMTDRLEDVSNQIYHLQQRLEVLERKLDVNRI